MTVLRYATNPKRWLHASATARIGGDEPPAAPVAETGEPAAVAAALDNMMRESKYEFKDPSRLGNAAKAVSLVDSDYKMTRSDFIEKRAKESVALKCQVLADRCKRGDWVEWREWAEVAHIETSDDARAPGCGWEIIDLPPDPRLSIPEDDQFCELMQDAATAIAKNTYYDPYRKVQILREIYYRLQEAEFHARSNPAASDYMGYMDPDTLNRVLRIEHSPWKKFVKHNPEDTVIPPALPSPPTSSIASG